MISSSVSDTFKIGKAIARNLVKGDILCLFGELGSGKTVFTKGVAAGLGIKKSAIISPSFVLIRQYANTKLPLNHFDLYRLKTARDIIFLGYEEYLYDEAVTVIEWADRLGYLLPGEHLGIAIDIKGKEKREIKIIPRGKHYRDLLGKISLEMKNLKILN